MSGTEVFLTILGGVALLLWGARMIRTGMTRAFGTELRSVVAAWTSNRIFAAGAGALVASLVQSSTATALIVCSFVGRGALTTAPALAVMLGADLGSSVAVVVVASGIAAVWPVFAFLGYVVHASGEKRSPRIKHIGRILIGFAMLLVALNVIGTASRSLGNSEIVSQVLNAMANEPFLAVVVGLVLTWMAYSSVAVVLLVSSLAVAGAFPVDALMTIVLGVNLGAALPAISATIAEPISARRVPLGNLFFRFLGVVACWIALPWLEPELVRLVPGPAEQVVAFHVAFNAALCVLSLVLVGPIAVLTTKVLPEPAVNLNDTGPRHLDEHLLETPSLALSMAARETLRMGDIIEDMLAKTIRVFREDDKALLSDVEAQEDQVDQLYEAVKLYLMRLSRDELDDDESRRCIEIITFTTNLEHVGDIIDKNLMELAAKKIKGKLSFSDQGLSELANVHAMLMETVRLSLSVFISQDAQQARSLMARKDQFRKMELEGTEWHLERLRSGMVESIETSSLHLDMLRDFKRINSHLTSVAYPILSRRGELRSSRLVSEEQAERLRSQGLEGNSTIAEPKS
ncbi:Na/Pi cotransporter family protein [Pelagibius sp. Alg239-R121]|uniref:Na/Pi cotransporter family protein n=1 Tax=Pelagibius sp. Alg239-R121 TaxID=2993448 RepID=UPI0024A61F05|nr:Na/Pi cotransporter family protein [Pelagibius sp. Alg239-R121]